MKRKGERSCGENYVDGKDKAIRMIEGPESKRGQGRSRSCETCSASVKASDE